MLIESVVCYRWRPIPGYRSTFGPETVNVLRAMVARHYTRPVRFINVTDDPAGLDSGIEVVPLWSDFADIPSPHGQKNPSCYRRLRAFSPDIAAVFGQRFVSLDLDCVITGDMRPLWDRNEDFVSWGDTNTQPGSHYNGSMMLLTAGARRKVWDTFDPLTSPERAKRSGCWGSDQGWLSYCLGPGEATWTKKDGVYSYRNHIQPRNILPENAKAVFFHGRHDPWGDVAQRIDWVRQHWQKDTPCLA